MGARARGSLVLALIGIVVVVARADVVSAGGTAVCPRDDDPPLAQSLMRPRDSCSASCSPVIGVMEGDESVLINAWSLAHKRKGDYVAVLFYASWCPFSKISRPNFNIVSHLFPSIHHFTFDESLIRPSILSRHGVYGFPTLFLLNSTMRVRYHGSRTANSFIAFYSNVTGIKPRSLDQISKKNFMNSLNEADSHGDMEHENCPFSWARSPEKLLEQDAYLALASAFLMIRIMYFLIPKLLKCGNRAWRRHIRYASLMNLSQVCVEKVKNKFSLLNPYCKRHNLQEGALNAGAWASKSLASVSIGETSSGRIHSVHEKR